MLAPGWRLRPGLCALRWPRSRRPGKFLIGGGGDDWFTQICKSYSEQYRKQNPGFNVRYHSWSEPDLAEMEIRSVPADAHVTLVGHSWGGSAAFQAVALFSSVDVMISIDPVGRLRVPWGMIRAHCRQWLYVRAQPDDKHKSSDDVIAAIGGKYPPPPPPGRPNAPDYVLTANATHGDFGSMMRVTSKGVSGEMLLGGRRVP